MIDLYTIYKNFYSRSHSNPHDYDYEEMTELVHNLVKNLYMCRFDETKRENALAESIVIAKDLEAIEHGKGRLKVYYSLRLLEALETDQYIINVPYSVRPRWEEPVYGILYILISRSRPGECKLGSTTMDINTRVIKYMKKYGYDVEVYFTSPEILDPFWYEYVLGARYKKFRCIGNVYGDSIEWYSLDPIILRNEILKIESVAKRN